MLILNEHAVRELLSFRECIAIMEGAMRALARGEVHQPLRSLVRAEGAPGFLGLMPAYHAAGDAGFALKAVCVYPGNPARGLDTHLGSVLLFARETGQLLAVVDASAVTAIRTAAVSAVATRLLARRNARVLTIFGTGAQARAHIAALEEVCAFEEIRVVGRTLARAEELVRDVSARATIRPFATAEEGLRDCDVIVTATNSPTPILARELVPAGVHINAVGSSVRSARELDTATMRDALLFVDWPESTLNESGDFLMAQAEGAIGPEHIRATLGDVLLGSAPGRTSDVQITLFKSLGLAIEDHATANFLYDKAKREGKGVWVE